MRKSRVDEQRGKNACIAANLRDCARPQRIDGDLVPPRLW